MELSARNLFTVFEKYKSTINGFAAVCQCRHETTYRGKPWNSELCLNANNLAGLKKWSGWNGGVYPKSSWEQKPDGTKYEKVSEFCKYATWTDFVDNYAKKIQQDYPLCTASADNFWGYFSGLFKGRFGAWATDLAYLDRLIDQVFAVGPVLLGSEWEEKCWKALEYAVQKKRLQPGHEQKIRQRLEEEIPRGASLFPANGLIVCIDPGHGLTDPGAIGPSGTKESNVVLAIANYASDALRSKGYKVIQTRTGANALNQAKSVDLRMRCDIANSAGADVFVSIHANSSTNRTAGGTEVLMFPSSSKGNVLASNILTGLIAATGLKNRGLKDRADLYVLRNTKMPSALAEVAFISNPTEEALLRDPAWQRKAGEAIAQGVEQYLKG